MAIMILKRNGRREVLDITKIQKKTKMATKNLEGVSQSDLELDSQIKFIDGMTSSDIQDTLIKTAVTVKASKKADKNAAENKNVNDNVFLDLIFKRSLVKIVSIRFFIK